MKQFPVITTLSPEQEIWLQKKMAEHGITHMSERKRTLMALLLNGPVITAEQARIMRKSRKSWRLGV